MKQAWETVVAFKLVWIRVALYAAIPSVTTFLSQTETWSGQTWNDTATFLKVRVLLYSSLAGCMALAAFIDSSMQRAREDLKQRRDDTQFLTKDTGP